MRAAIPLLLLFGLPALAECPVPTDMETGIQLTEANGETETFFKDEKGFVRGAYDDGTGSGSRYLLKDGIYVIEAFDTLDGDVIAGSRTTFSYPDTAPSPLAEERWDLETFSFIQGEILTGRESHIFGPMTQIDIGSCSYDMVPIISIFHDQDGYEEHLNYVVDFGFAYLVEMKERNAAPDIYSYIGISALTRP